MIGRTIGSYRITKLLGEGGMGTVYQATDNIEREVAIKALRPQLTHDESRLERFRSEAMALGRLHHPNITSLFHLLEADETFYMVMEFVEGQTLDDLLRQHGALPPRLALDILLDGLHGFEHAHSRGVIHRDIKASNLMVSSEGTTKIMDFGIARMDGTARLTKNGQQIGTLEYMSPEQVRGLEQDARSDIYSLGILLFELLTGRVPFTDANDFELMRAHIEKAPPSVRHLVPSLPPALDEIIAKALAKQPEARFQDVAEFRSALESVAAELPADATLTLPDKIKTPNERYGTMPLDDKYGTRLQGTPLPVPHIAQPTAEPIAVAPRLPIKPMARRWMLPALVIGGMVLLLLAFLVRGMLHPPPKNQAITHRAPLAPTSIRHQPHPTAAPIQKSSAHHTRKYGQPIRPLEKPHRVRHEVVLRRSAKASPAKIVKHLPHRQARGDEKAALRAIIKDP